MSWERDVCKDTLQQYLKAFDAALLQYNEDMTQWYRQEPLVNTTDYPIFLSASYNKFFDQEHRDKIRADCQCKGLGYSEQGTCDVLRKDCQLECHMTDAGIADLLRRWQTAKPTFAAPKLEEYVCSQCEQNVRNYVGNVSQDASTLYRNVVQEAVQECVLNLNTSTGSERTPEPTPEPTTEGTSGGTSGGTGIYFGRRELSFTALVFLAVVLVILSGFLF